MARANILLVKGEVESSFCEENGAHSWFDHKTINAEFTPSRQTHDGEVNKQRATEAQDTILGRLGGSLKFGSYLAGDGTELDSAATATDDSLQTLLEHSLGGSASDAGSTADGVPTTTSIPVQVGHGTRFSVGQAILVENGGGSGIYEASVIESIAGDTLTLAWALTAAPAAGDDVLNGYCAYVDPDATSTMQFQWIGDDNADEYLALGCAGAFTLENLLGLDGVPRILWDFAVTKWETDTATLAAGSFDGSSPVATNTEIEVLYGTHGVTTRNRLSVSELAMNPGHKWTPHYARGNQDHEHVDRYVRQFDGVSASFTPDIAAGYETDFAAQTYKRLTYIYGRTPGSVIVIDLPRIRISALPERASHGADQLARKVQFRGYEDDASTATAIGRSPFRITRL